MAVSLGPKSERTAGGIPPRAALLRAARVHRRPAADRGLGVFGRSRVGGKHSGGERRWTCTTPISPAAVRRRNADRRTVANHPVATGWRSSGHQYISALRAL